MPSSHRHCTSTRVVVEMPVVMQRKVPQIRNVLKTAEIPPAKFVDRIVDAPRP